MKFHIGLASVPRLREISLDLLPSRGFDTSLGTRERFTTPPYYDG